MSKIDNFDIKLASIITIKNDPGEWGCYTTIDTGYYEQEHKLIPMTCCNCGGGINEDYVCKMCGTRFMKI